MGKLLKQGVNNQTKWVLGWLGRWALLILGIALYTLIIAREADAKAAAKYEDWKGRYVTDFLAQQDAARAGMPVDPYEAQLDAEAQALARVLYGVKDNSTDNCGLIAGACSTG